MTSISQLDFAFHSGAPAGSPCRFCTDAFGAGFTSAQRATETCAAVFVRILRCCLVGSCAAVWSDPALLIGRILRCYLVGSCTAVIVLRKNCGLRVEWHAGRSVVSLAHARGTHHGYTLMGLHQSNSPMRSPLTPVLTPRACWWWS